MQNYEHLSDSWGAYLGRGILERTGISAGRYSGWRLNGSKRTRPHLQVFNQPRRKSKKVLKTNTDQKPQDSPDDRIHFLTVGALRSEMAGQEVGQIIAGDLKQQAKVVHLA